MPGRDVTAVQIRKNTLVATVQRAALDERSANSLEQEVSAAASQHPGLPVVLDMGRVSFAPSVALGALVRLRNGFRFESRRLILANVLKAVRDTLAVTRLDRVLELQPNVESALKAIGESKPDAEASGQNP
ncbi:MAG: STAS domain-containing protein [Phycisphaerae bacterium]|jgi:anti-anti-sigma factor